jgi:hypothetical protein
MNGAAGAMSALGGMIQAEVGISMPQGGGAVVKGGDGSGVFISSSGSVRTLPIKLNALNWGVAVPAGGSAVVRDVSGGFYLVTASGSCTKLAVP